MAGKRTQEVYINGRIYQLSGYESQEYLQKVAAYINHMIEEMKELEAYRRLSGDERQVLIELNIADDYFKAKDRVAQLENEADSREKDLYEMKHQLAAAKVKVDELTAALEEKNQAAVHKPAAEQKTASEKEEPTASSAAERPVHTQAVAPADKHLSPRTAARAARGARKQAETSAAGVSKS